MSFLLCTLPVFYVFLSCNQVPKTLKPWRRWRAELAMNVTATGGLTFEDSVRVDFDSKTKSIFIQTDKAMYKPGEEGACISLDSNIGRTAV